MTDKLPSIDDFYEELPSKDEVIKEEKLPSINEFVEEEEEEVVEEKNKCKEGEYFCNDEQKCKPIPDGHKVLDDGELVKESQDLSEVLHLINAVRRDIPQIPEIKYYDEELKDLASRIENVKQGIPEVPEIKYYDHEVEAICEEIDKVREEIKDLPEVKYYDEQVTGIEDRIDRLQQDLINLPEVKYYDKEIEAICGAIDDVRSEIPTFPKWVNEVNEVPDFTWIGKTFSVIDDDFIKVGDNIKDLRDRFDADFKDLSESLDTKDFEKRVQIDEVKADIKETNTKIYKELKETAIKIWDHHHQFKDDDRKLKKLVLSKLNEAKQNVEKQISKLDEKTYESNQVLKKYFDGLKEEISNLPEPKNYDDKFRDLRKSVKGEVSRLSLKFDDILESNKDTRLNISELYKLVGEIKSGQELLTETNIPLGSDSPDTNNPDPLTPIDQNFVTVDQLQKHYKLFVERVQYQLSSIGGGGAGFIKDLDDVDISGLANDYILQYDASTSKWKTVVGNIGAGGTWTVGESGIHTTKSVGIGTTARSDFKLYVSTGSTADTVAYFDGHISVGGSVYSREVVDIESVGIITGLSDLDIRGNTKILGITTVGFITATDVSVSGAVTATKFVGDISDSTNYPFTSLTGITTTILGDATPKLGGDLDGNSKSIDSVNNLNVTGITTLGSITGVGTVTVGVGNTALLVEGDSRVLGILTVGSGSVTIDGTTNTINIGDEDVTITNSAITIGSGVTISASASGINSAPNVLYVAKDGLDTNNGTSIDNAFLTIKAAVGIATSETTVKVLSGTYVEDNPITLPAFCSVVGDDLRTVKVLPNNSTQDIFHVNKGTKLANMTFSGHLAPSAAVAFPTAGATNVGGGKWKGPYVQNCTSDTTTGTGIRIDGNLAVKTKSMNVDAFTQYNQGGVGVAVTNEGYAQLVSVFTICCDQAITAHKGGQADVANSNCSFGTFGLVADGIGSQQFTGIVTAEADAAQDNIIINVGAGTTRPYDGQVVFFDKLYKSVETVSVGSGGTGYTSTPTVTIDAPTGPNGETATAFATVENESVASITIISSGSQYEVTPTVTIAAPNVGINTATATASMDDLYYTINSSTPVSSGIATLTLAENLINTVGVGSTAFFFQQSKIVASSHTFEYIGSGNTITLATPKRGGVTVQENEVVTTNGGNVVYTSTDQSGNFRIGDDLQINQTTGTISGRSFSKSLFSEMTPFILALS